MISVLHAPVRRVVLVLGGAPPATTIHFTWDAVATATSYVLKVGTTSMQATGDTHDANVGSDLAHDVALGAGTFYARTVVVGGAHDGELTSEGERGFILSAGGTIENVVRDTEVYWTWTDAGGGTVTFWRIKWGTASGVYWTDYDIADPDARSVLMADVLSGELAGLFYAAVVACNGDGEGATSSEVSFYWGPV